MKMGDQECAEAPILTVASPRYLKRYGKPKHPLELTRHRCLRFIDPHAGRPYDWVFMRADETIDVPVSGPLTFTDPKSMLQECLAGTGIAQVIGWGFGQLLERENWWTSSRIGTVSVSRSSPSIHRARTRQQKFEPSSTSSSSASGKFNFALAYWGRIELSSRWCEPSRNRTGSSQPVGAFTGTSSGARSERQKSLLVVFDDDTARTVPGQSHRMFHCGAKNPRPENQRDLWQQTSPNAHAPSDAQRLCQMTPRRMPP
jgi:hypothetical protein